MGRIEDIKARLLAATPGPWVNLGGVEPYDCVVSAEGPTPICQDPEVDDRPEDREFIANAPADTAFLLAQIETLEASLADAASGLARAGEQIEALTAEANRECVERQALEARLRLWEAEWDVHGEAEPAGRVRVTLDPRTRRIGCIPVGPKTEATPAERARKVLLDIAEGREPHTAPAVRVSAAKALLGVS